MLWRPERDSRAPEEVACCRLAVCVLLSLAKEGDNMQGGKGKIGVLIKEYFGLTE
jgi:hypothetical protein